MMKKIGTVLGVGIFSALCIGAFAYTMVTASDKGIIVKCNTLQEQSEEYKTDGFSERPLFWITQADKDLCDGVNINISAPIGNPYEKNI